MVIFSRRSSQRLSESIQLPKTLFTPMNSEQILEALTEYELAFIADLFKSYRLRRFKAIAKIEKPLPQHQLEKANLTALQGKLDNLHQLAVNEVNRKLASANIDAHAIWNEGIE